MQNYSDENALNGDQHLQHQQQQQQSTFWQQPGSTDTMHLVADPQGLESFVGDSPYNYTQQMSNEPPTMLYANPMGSSSSHPVQIPQHQQLRNLNVNPSLLVRRATTDTDQNTFDILHSLDMDSLLPNLPSANSPLAHAASPELEMVSTPTSDYADHWETASQNDMDFGIGIRNMPVNLGIHGGGSIVSSTPDLGSYGQSLPQGQGQGQGMTNSLDPFQQGMAQYTGMQGNANALPHPITRSRAGSNASQNPNYPEGANLRHHNTVPHRHSHSQSNSQDMNLLTPGTGARLRRSKSDAGSGMSMSSRSRARARADPTYAGSPTHVPSSSSPGGGSAGASGGGSNVTSPSGTSPISGLFPSAGDAGMSQADLDVKRRQIEKKSREKRTVALERLKSTLGELLKINFGDRSQSEVFDNATQLLKEQKRIIDELGNQLGRF